MASTAPLLSTKGLWRSEPRQLCEIWHVHQAVHPSLVGPYLYVRDTEPMSYFMRALYGPVLYKVRVKRKH